MEKSYIAIDLKSFYASAECVERGLDPLKARLVVADPTRTDKTICLAVSPELKKLGIAGRARLYEVYAKTHDFIIAPPQMRKYMQISKDIFKIYASFVATEDIHVYSIDEVFIDATPYLKNYKMTAHELARAMIHKVLAETGITATAGIGTNLYLAKIAMDIEAKHMPADADGVRIAELDEMSYRYKLWDHQPLSDFWRIGRGYSRRLKNLGIYTMGDLAKYSLTGSSKLYHEFGVNAELLIDHAWGYEPVTMRDIKSYHADNHSLSSGQVLMRPYNFHEARTVLGEMAEAMALDLVRQESFTDQITLTVEYDISNLRNYHGTLTSDFYGREIPKPAHGTANLNEFTSSSKQITNSALALFEKIADQAMTIRKIYLAANHVKNNACSAKNEQMNIFTDYEAHARESQREHRKMKAILAIKDRFGKNAILSGRNFEDGATGIQRNNQVGGHKA